ncbi:MAG: response regulator [Acidobacteria bacterium]|nr:response regulator [Acidobacteriota bacterium]
MFEQARGPTAESGRALLGQLRHELRTPLNAVIGYSEMLLEDGGDARGAASVAALRRIHEGGTRLLAILNGALDPEKLEASGGRPDLGRIEAELRARTRLPLESVIAHSRQLLGQLGADDFAADVRRIHEAALRLRAQLASLRHIGRAASESADVFTPTSLEWVAPAPGGGERGLLLVVDDTENNRDILARYLVRRGHEVVTAAGGAEALALLRARRFDLVLLDVVMPEMNGFEVVQTMKADGTLAQIPVIFISALDDPTGKVQALRAGGADYVTKPFQAEEVIARVENQLKLSRLQLDLARQNRELVRKNEELVRAQRRTELVFSALAEVLPGTVLDDKYRLEEMIGTGGFGAVYRATHLGLELPVAVKVFRPISGNDSPAALERFRQEGVSAARIKHPHAVEILDNGISSSGIAYLVMELLTGRTLAAELGAGEPATPQRAVEVLRPVCAALAEIHAAGIVHRDIKPENIYLHQDRRGEVVKLLDFGVSKMLGGDAATSLAPTMTRGVVGTPAYMAPERLLGEPYDGRSDVYSLGVILFRMLCGRLPFQVEDGTGYAVAIKQLTSEVPSLRGINPRVPEPLERVALDALAREACDRPTARELAALLEQTIAGS